MTKAKFEEKLVKHLRWIGKAYKEAYPQGEHLNLSIFVDEEGNNVQAFNAYWGRDAAFPVNVREPFQETKKER